MSEQPPVQPSNPESNPASNQPAAGSPTQPMSAAESSTPSGPTGPPTGSPRPPAGPAGVSPSGGAPKRGVWQRATSTSGGRWGLGLAAAALAALMILGIAIAGFVVLRSVDRVDHMGQRQGGQFLREDRPGNGRGPFADDRKEMRKELKKELQDERRQMPGMPGLPGGGGRGVGGPGNLMGAQALHGEVTATVDGSVQALLFQRGEVTAVSATSITLKSSDGFVGTYGRTAATTSRGAVPVKGGQAFVLARASDKVALTTMATKAEAASGS